ncbi:hypothetical protein [Streptomyces sp. NPDC058279]
MTVPRTEGSKRRHGAGAIADFSNFVPGLDLVGHLQITLLATG